MAASRQAKALGWSDRGGKWQATPEPLKQLIDSYSAAPKEVRIAVLARLTADQASSQKLRQLLHTQKANYRENDRGWSAMSLIAKKKMFLMQKMLKSTPLKN